MRGGFLHNEVLIGPLRREAQRHGLQSATEAPVRLADQICYVDLLLNLEGKCIAVEAECSTRRVRRDIEKAAAFSADELWIIVPHVGLAKAVLRALVRIKAPVGVKVIVFTQGQALRRLREILALISKAIPPTEKNALIETTEPSP